MASLLQHWNHEEKTRLPDLLDKLANRVKTVHPDCTVILFGSYHGLKYAEWVLDQVKQALNITDEEIAQVEETAE